jgi:uncharacterized protein YoaH (UPF0181 family)
MSNTQKALADNVARLMAEGKSLEEALTIALADQPGDSKTHHSLEGIKSMTDLQELRRIRKVAFAKISKGSKNATTMASYHEEQTAASERITELLKEIKASASPWEKAKAYNEDLSGITQIFLDSYQKTLNDKLDKAINGKLTKVAIKGLIARSKMTTSLVPKELEAGLLVRAKANDQRVVTLLRMNGLVDQIKANRAAKTQEKKN